MKCIYNLPVDPAADIGVPDGTNSITFENCEVRWDVSDGKLSSVVLEIHGERIPADPNAAIPADYDLIEQRAFRLANYIANRIRMQTGVNAIDPDHVQKVQPELLPEEGEEEEFTRRRKRIFTTLTVLWGYEKVLQPSDFPAGFRHAPAFAFYADALRAQSLFIRYELLYKVIEYFFRTEDRDLLPRQVSRFATPHDSRFSQRQIRRLRTVRNRCVHPRHEQHLNPQELTAIRHVREHLRLLQDLARLLLQHLPAVVPG